MMEAQRKHWIGVTVGAGLTALLLAPQGPLGGFWGADGEDPMGGALFALTIYAILEAAVFGFGVAFMLFGMPMLRRQGAGDRLTRMTFVAIVWALVSWWPHGSFHQAIEENNFEGLAAIEWGFHATMLVCGVVIATFFWRVLNQTALTSAPSASRADAAALR
jgi:hypothetical protein